LAAQKVSYHQKSTKKKHSSKPKKKGTGACHYCKSHGHFIKQCQKWISDGRPSKAQQQSKQVMLSPTEHGAEALAAEMMLVDSSAFAVENNQDAWYIDIGATSHVTNRRYFQNP
jgi:hypothetical protein